MFIQCLNRRRRLITWFLGVLLGALSAAPAQRFFEHKMGVTLKVVETTRAIPHTLFTIHPRVPSRERGLIKQRILGWADTEAGREMLALGRLKPFVTVSDSEYDVVRTMAGRSD